MTSAPPSIETSSIIAPGPRLGLALSGGGFRAAFFHIGVLARMSVLGLLRHVEVISTVSGGSIIGALYYLHVKRLLEAVPDAEVTDRHYQAIVERIERDFQAAVQKSMLVQVFASLTRNLKMLAPSYTRSHRLGELYDEHFFRSAWGQHRTTPILMRELRIEPAGHTGGFKPLDMNAARKARVPMLYINAATLNTGRDWGFNAVRMGEPALDDPVVNEIDKKTRLRRPAGYDELPDAGRDFPLGLAVAASACVPGLCPPLGIEGLYPDVTVQLVDGGVIDNQGVSALMTLGCDRIVISDASGQLEFEPHPGLSALGALGRVNSILLDRVRDLELRARLEARRVPTVLLHLRKGLDAEAIGCATRTGVPREETHERMSAVPCESFGVSREVQDPLSRVRTALDAFSDIEAEALMMDAYLMTGAELRASPELAELIPAGTDTVEESWGFLHMRAQMAHPSEEFLHHLRVASEPLFRYFRLDPAAKKFGLVALAAALGGICFAERDLANSFIDARVRVWHLAVALIVVLSLVFYDAALRDDQGKVRPLGAAMLVLRGVTLHALLSVAGAVVAQLHLGTLNPLFLRIGRSMQLRTPESQGPPSSGEEPPSST